MKEEELFRAIGDVGGDLIDMAEKATFAPSRWRRWGSIAACLVVLAGLTALLLPYVTMGSSENSTATVLEAKPGAAPEEPAAEDMASVEEDTDSTAEAALKTDMDGMNALASKEQLIFGDVIYYVEALYSDEEAQTHLGRYLGTVTDADEEAYIGERVYQKSGSDMQDGLPLEIFVLTEKGYLYCLTYYASAGAYCTEEQVLELLETGGEEELLEELVRTIERGIPDTPDLETPDIWNFEDPSELRADQLTVWFLLMLEQQAATGYRSWNLYSYLWFQPAEGLPEDAAYDREDGRYVVPLEDMTGVLDRYLDGYTLDPLELKDSYDAAQNALILSSTPDLDLFGDEPQPALRLAEAGYEEATQTLRLVVERYADETYETLTAVRTYTIRLENGGCYYDSIVTEKY